MEVRKGLARTIAASTMGVGLVLGFAETASAHFASTTPMVDGAGDETDINAISPKADSVEQGTRKWKKDEYIAEWEKANKRKMTDREKGNLDRGCIGVSVVNIEGPFPNPPLHLSFGTFEQSQAAQTAIAAILRKTTDHDKFLQLAAKDKFLKNLTGLAEAIYYVDLTKVEPVIFSQRFYMGGENGGPKQYEPNKYGQIDMSKYTYNGKPEYVNFDFAWFDKYTNNWWHANHMEYSDPKKRKKDPMYIYQSTQKHYSRPLLDFDGQVYAVAFGARDVSDTSDLTRDVPVRPATDAPHTNAGSGNVDAIEPGAVVSEADSEGFHHWRGFRFRNPFRHIHLR